MSIAPAHLLYGHPLRGLVEIRPHSAQVSPLVPGGAPLEDLPPESADSAVIYAPPGTLERRYTLALVIRALAVGAPFTVLAPKDKGGSRLGAELKAFGCAIVEDSRSHHKIVITTRPTHPKGVADALAEGGLQLHPSHGLWTQPGIFSWDRIDVGSALLLKHLPTFTGRGADLGAGLGVLSQAVLKAPDVNEITLSDIDHRAITAARRNIKDPRARFVWSDIRDAALPAQNLDFIVMNPPFHDTGIEDQSLGQKFIERAATMLKKGGVCWLTANRHLPYETLLKQYFATVKPVDTADGFKIIMAEK